MYYIPWLTIGDIWPSCLFFHFFHVDFENQKNCIYLVCIWVRVTTRASVLVVTGRNRHTNAWHPNVYEPWYAPKRGGCKPTHISSPSQPSTNGNPPNFLVSRRFSVVLGDSWRFSGILGRWWGFLGTLVQSKNQRKKDLTLQTAVK